MELRVNDYVRTNKGNIAKIVKITDLTIICDYIIYPSNYGFNKQLRKENLKRLGVKSGSNIIDLIEVGDYVNGSKVVKIEEHNEELYVYVQETEYCNACDEEENIYYKENTIKSIVTKEQFSQMEYRIGE